MSTVPRALCLDFQPSIARRMLRLSQWATRHPRMGNGGGGSRSWAGVPGQMYPRSYPTLPFCLVLEGCRLVDAREGGGGDGDGGGR